LQQCPVQAQRKDQQTDCYCFGKRTHWLGAYTSVVRSQILGEWLVKKWGGLQSSGGKAWGLDWILLSSSAPG
jgi:hypothetical protein